MRYIGFASVLPMVLGVSLCGIAQASDCRMHQRARRRQPLVPCGPQYVTKNCLRSGDGYGRADLHGDSLHTGNTDSVRSCAAR